MKKMLAVLVVLSMAASAQAVSVGVNFWSSTQGFATTGLYKTDVAGEVPQNNWNNFQQGGADAPTTAWSTTGSALRDSTGVVTTMSYSASSEERGTNDWTSASSNLMRAGVNGLGYADSYADFTLSNIPYATYDVYVYSNGKPTAVYANQTGTSWSSNNHTSYLAGFQVVAAGGAPVPEPLTMTAAFLAIGGLGSYLRKRSRVA